MTPHEVVIRFGRPFDIHTPNGSFLADVREITVPFADRESAEAAQREISVHVRPVRDAGGEDYRPVVAGEVITLTEEDLRDLERRANHPCPGCGHLPDAHESGRPTPTLFCRNCPDGICYVWTLDGGEVGPGALPRSVPGGGP